MSTTIKVRYRCIGFHRWPGATGERAYLADRHRHEWQIEVTCGVRHDDRDVEFHDLKDMVAELAPAGEQGDRSCEAMARQLMDNLNARLSAGMIVAVEVWEDGECGARVEL